MRSVKQSRLSVRDPRQLTKMGWWKLIKLTDERHAELQEYIDVQQHIVILGPPKTSERNLTPTMRLA